MSRFLSLFLLVSIASSQQQTDTTPPKCLGQPIGFRFCAGSKLGFCNPTVEGGAKYHDCAKFLGIPPTDQSFEAICLSSSKIGAHCEKIAKTGECKGKGPGKFCLKPSVGQQQGRYVQCPQNLISTCAEVKSATGKPLISKCISKSANSELFESCQQVFTEGLCEGRVPGLHCLDRSFALNCDYHGDGFIQGCSECKKTSKGAICLLDWNKEKASKVVLFQSARNS